MFLPCRMPFPKLTTRFAVSILFLCSACLIPLHAQPSLGKPAQRQTAPWPPPTGELRVIIDTDAANEVDDQWAIALAVGFPERLKIEGFVAAHYGQRGGVDGIAKSKASLEATLAAAGMTGKYTIKPGSDPFTYRERVPESAGVDFIIATAHTATPENPLWLVLLGPATDGAAALLKDPSIADRLIIFWHGRSEWPQRCMNFNALNDPAAARLVFELPCRFVLFDTGTHLTMPMDECERRVSHAGPLGKFLYDIRTRSAYARRADKGMFDLGDIAALIDPAGTCTWESVPAPSVRLDYTYDFKSTNGPLLRIPTIDRDASFKLLDQSLARIAKTPASPKP
jgi:purine nucleosidase